MSSPRPALPGTVVRNPRSRASGVPVYVSSTPRDSARGGTVVPSWTRKMSNRVPFPAR